MIKKIAIVFLFLLLIACNEHKVSSSFDLEINNITLIDEKGNQLNGLYDVFLKKGQIAAITETDSAPTNRADTLIDGTDKFLLLGFWDNHTHFRGGPDLIDQNEVFLKQFLHYGITTVRDAGGDLTPQINKWNVQSSKGSRLAPTIYTSGPKLDGKNARWQGSLEVNSILEIENALDSLQRLNVDYVKLYDSTISGDMYLAILRQAEQRNMITSGHMPFTVTLDEAIDAGLDNIEHLYYVLKGCSSREREITEDIKSGSLDFWGSMSQLIDSYDEETAQKTFSKLKKANVYVTPTLHIGSILSYLDEIDHSSDTYLDLLQPEFIATYEGRIRSALKASDEAKSNRKELQQFFMTLTRSLDDAGVKLLAGSDSGAYNSYIYPGLSLHGELEELVEAGIPPSKALSAMYRGAAFLKKDGYQLKVDGKANLVLLNQNPLIDIKATRDINVVIKDGIVILKN